MIFPKISEKNFQFFPPTLDFSKALEKNFQAKLKVTGASESEHGVGLGLIGCLASAAERCGGGWVGGALVKDLVIQDVVGLGAELSGEPFRELLYS